MIYLDNSATTKPSKAACDAVMKTLTENFGNPSSRYTLGLAAEKELDDARDAVARSMGAKAKNIIFTSGGTESDNLAILGGANIKTGNHAVTTAIEHPAVLNAFKHLEETGFSVTYVNPGRDGVVTEESILSAVKPGTSFVSIMHVNNETGAIMPIEHLSAKIKRISPRALFHVDAVQSYGKLKLTPSKWGVDLMSVSSHKIHGPKGVGALFKSDKVNIKSLAYGGGQENSMRAGTENMPGIVGFGAAADEVNPKEHYENVKELKMYLAEKLLSLPDTEVNGDLEESLPYVLNISFIGIRSEIMLNALNGKEIYVSAGSACSAGESKASSVLFAMGAAHPDNAIRFSFSKNNTMDEMKQTVEAVINILEMLR